MSIFIFGQREIASKDFHKQRQIIDIFLINANKVMLSEKTSCNNGKDWWYIVGYQVDGEKLYHCLSGHPKTYLSMACHNTTRTLPTKLFNVSEALELSASGIETFGMRLGHCYLKN